MPKQRLILLFDGTWNDPADQTNVYEVARLLDDYDGSIRQRFYYDPGVGTSKFDRLRGGLFGSGLSKNLQQGYEWLARRYTDGDEIWVFGFSRGAYTARSLIGLIRKCGLLHIVTPCLLDKAEAIYRDKDLAPDSLQCKSFRENYSRFPRIHFIGVWDTVGALGIPGTNFSEKGTFSWHDTELSSLVDYAYHAIALDEHRAAYESPLWTSKDGQQKAANKDVEQRWFIGAHANVGGGYGCKDLLPQIPLAWLLSKAKNVGLKFEPFTVDPNAWKAPPNDSYKDFLNGLYAWFRRLKSAGDGRFIRKYAHGPSGKPAVNVAVDESVWQRWQDDTLHYRPRTLVDAGLSPPKNQTPK